MMRRGFRCRHATRTPTLSLRIKGSRQRVSVPGIPSTSGPQVFRHLQRTMTFLHTQYNASIFKTNFTRVFSTSVLVTTLSIPTSSPTTLITRGFRLIFLHLQRAIRLSGNFIRPRIQRRVTGLLPNHLHPRLLGLYRRLNHEKRRVGLQVIHFRMIRRRLQISSSTTLCQIFLLGRNTRNITLFV